MGLLVEYVVSLLDVSCFFTPLLPSFCMKVTASVFVLHSTLVVS